MVIAHILTHGLFYSAVAIAYLFLMMVVFSPRVWGSTDYPERIKQKVPAQTRKERTLAAAVGLPWFVFILGFPVSSTLALKAKLGSQIPFMTSFLNILAMMIGMTLGDLVLLDWLLVSKITPRFVIIPGTVKDDYRDFSHHYQSHARAVIPMIILSLIIAGLVSGL
ncbi:MAG: hypothetical protein OEW18_00450 [Candidatus Aminicenantes bacterium]|nr:hypothetical protein [Candidatus Aminicenantes bacterium]